MKWEWKRRREHRRDREDNQRREERTESCDIRWTICKQGCMVSLENKVIFIAWASLNGCLHLLSLFNSFFILGEKSKTHVAKQRRVCATSRHSTPKTRIRLWNYSLAFLFSHSRGKPKFKCANVWYMSTQLCLSPPRTLSSFVSLSLFWWDWAANGCGCLPLITHFYWAISRLPVGCCQKRVRKGLGKINAIFSFEVPFDPPKGADSLRSQCCGCWRRSFQVFLLFGEAWIHSWIHS